MMKLVSIVLSFYNEEENIEKLFEELDKVEKSVSRLVEFEYVCVNDGSSDSTLLKLNDIQKTRNNVNIFHLYRNFGHEVAMTAGMDNASGDCVIFMDGDLQHPPYLLEALIKSWLSGNKVVLTKKKNNGQDKSKVYRVLSNLFHIFLNKISDINIPKDFPDFRLVDFKYIEMLKKIDEQDRMFRGLLNYIGISAYDIIEFDVPERFRGTTKYNFSSSFSLAIDSILQFSIKPLRLAIFLGLTTITISIFLALSTLIQYIFYDVERTGYTTTLLVVLFLGSSQLIVLGIIGEYIGRIHIESKKKTFVFWGVNKK
ncbi:glycosyltransferase family 2 protein [Vibrio aestuarianus]|nr:glycosyltransferase family 2 protein [Vibrio aestuarianus]